MAGACGQNQPPAEFLGSIPEFQHEHREIPGLEIVLQGHASNVESSAETGKMLSFELGPYLIFLDQETSLPSNPVTGGAREIIQVLARPGSFTTTTVCVPKWAVLADAIMTRPTDKEYRFEEIHRYTGTIEKLDPKQPSMVIQFRAHGEMNSAYLNWPARAHPSLPDFRSLKEGQEVTVVASYRDGAYDTYWKLVQDSDRCDLPQSFYTEHFRTVIGIELH